MAIITIRDLLPRVQQYRPDVVDEVCIWALREAARDIARFSGIAEKVLSPIPLYAGAATQNVSLANPDNSIRVKRIKSIRIAQVPNPSSYLGGWDAYSNTPALDDSTFPSQYGFYIVTVGGTTSLGGISQWNAGDIIYSNGSAWKRMAVEEFTTVWVQNKPSVDRNINQPQAGLNMPLRWAERDGVAYFYPRPEFDIAVEYSVNYEPLGEFSEIGMTTDAIDGIVYGALEALYRLPGANMDLKSAEVWRMRFLKERANMKTLATYGDSGPTVIMPNNWVGRTSRLGPWRSTGWWL